MAREPDKKERVEVLFEQILAETKAVNEGVRALREQVERMGARLTGLDEHVGSFERTVSKGFKHVWERFDGLAERFDAHERLHLN